MAVAAAPLLRGPRQDVTRVVVPAAQCEVFQRPRALDDAAWDVRGREDQEAR